MYGMAAYASEEEAAKYGAHPSQQKNKPKGSQVILPGGMGVGYK